MNYGIENVIQDPNYQVNWRFPINISLAIVLSQKASQAAISNLMDSIQLKQFQTFIITLTKSD
jgi:hypothetical protein